MAETFVVVRTGFTPHNWFQQGKWSTPEQPFVLNNQTVRNLVSVGIPVIVLFVGLEDLPLYLVKVQSVRPRNQIVDSNYPYANELGPYLSFMTFDNSPIYFLTPEIRPIFRPALDSIRYVPGQELIIPHDLCSIPIHYYNALATNRAYLPLNTTYIVPSY
jgi:hypothetical protein